MSKRVDYVDIAKGLGILLVIFGHLKLDYFPYCGSVHIPLFFVAAGYLCDLRREEVRSYQEMVYKRCVRLLVPYFIYSMLLYAKYVLKLFIGSGAVIKDAIEAFLGILFSSSVLYKNVLPEDNFNGFVFGNGPLWFLTAMTISSVIFYAIVFFILRHQFHWGKVLSGMAFLTALSWGLCRILPFYLPWSFEMAVLGVVFMLFGLILRNTSVVEQWREHKTAYLWILLLSIGIFWPLHHFNGMANMAAQDYGKSMVVFVILGMLGSVIVFYLALMLEKTAAVGRILVYIGQNTLVILALHMTVVSMLISIMEKLHLSSVVKWGGFFVISSTVGLLVPLLFKEIMVRYCKVPKRYL